MSNQIKIDTKQQQNWPKVLSKTKVKKKEIFEHKKKKIMVNMHKTLHYESVMACIRFLF